MFINIGLVIELWYNQRMEYPIPIKKNKTDPNVLT